MNSLPPLKPLPTTVSGHSAPANPNPASTTQNPSSQSGPHRRMLPPSILLQGASGSGKTHALYTLLAAGKSVFVIGTEPGFITSLLEACQANKVSTENLHWMENLPATEGFGALEEMTTKIGTLDYKGISELKGVGKEKTRIPAYSLVKALQDFVSDKTGEHFGSFTDWDDSRVLVIDSLSGLSIIGWYLTVGHKPTAAQGEWNIAMNWIEAVIMKINSDRGCYFVLTAHIEKELEEITGVNRIMTSTLGRKLAPKLPRFFDEVVYAKRVKTAPMFRWATIDDGADLKNRSLPVGDALLPDFRPIIEAFDRRKKLMQA